MSKHLLAIAIGPVQEFIAAARRTRDLWFGSHLLSELSRAAASAVNTESGELIFPTAKDAGSNEATIANVVLAEVPADADPGGVARKAKEAVQKRWIEFAQEAHDEAGPRIVENLWQSQLDDVIEFYVAWTPLNGEYKQARSRVMRLLAGRKACRDFTPGHGRQGVPKSSLDGRRESVLRRSGDAAGAGKIQLAKGEQLCSVALTKRLAGGSRPYPSVARIAADPWLRGVREASAVDEAIRDAFRALQAECESLRFIHRLNGFDQYETFPFEGTAVYESRYGELAEEAGKQHGNLGPLRDALHRLTKSASSGGLGFGDADPYLAILVADGDRIGATLSSLPSAAEHRTFSEALAGFSISADRIVGNHQGVCVYAGGDDVLAFVPVDRVLECARKLRDAFRESLKEFGSPTLSAGIAIGHFMEPLEDLREYGGQAEKAAKQVTPDADGEGPFAERNGLAVRVHPRGGVEFGVREQWGNEGESLDRRLLELAGFFAARALPNKLPYDLRQLAEQLRGWNAPAQAVQAEAKLLLKRKQAGECARKKLAGRLSQCRSARDLNRLAREMLVSQWIAAGLRQSRTIQPQTQEED